MRPGPPHTREVNRRKIPANSANLHFRLVQSGHIQPAEDFSSGRLQTSKFFCICPPRILPSILRRAVLRKSFRVSLLAPVACLLPTAFQQKRDWDRISDTKRRHTSRPGLANGKNAGMRVASAGPAFQGRKIIRSKRQTISSISLISSSKSFSASFTGCGELMSTPAIFNSEMGSVLQPPDRKRL